nr:hypothetical protein [Tanacetum cinerariifolium]
LAVCDIVRASKKRQEKHVPNLLPKVITRIEDWKGRFFFVQGFIVPSDYPELLLKDNRWDKKSFKDKLPYSIHKNLFYQRLGRHPVNVRTFPGHILFLDGVKPSWEHGQQQLVIFVGGKEMTFRNFMYVEDDEDLSFLLREPSPSFSDGSPSTSINNEPSLLEAEPLDTTNPKQLVKNTADSEGSPAHERMFVLGTSSVARRMKDIKFRTKGYTKPIMKRKLVDVELLDLHDHCYARDAVVDNIMNRRARELQKVTGQMKGECDMLKERKKATYKECKELKAKCEAAMADFDNNLTVNVLRQKIKSLSGEENFATLESKVATLEAKKGRLEAVEATLHQEINAVKCDRVEVVTKVVPYAAMKLVHNDEVVPFEEVADMKYPFDLAKVKDSSTSVEAVLSKKPQYLCRLTPTKAHAPAPSAYS